MPSDTTRRSTLKVAVAQARELEATAIILEGDFGADTPAGLAMRAAQGWARQIVDSCRELAQADRPVRACRCSDVRGFEGVGNFYSDDPWERYTAHRAAKGY